MKRKMTWLAGGFLVLAGAAAAETAGGGGDVAALAVLMRWLHIGASIAAVGGSAFLWLVFLPAAKRTLTPETFAELRAAMHRRWAMVVHCSILLFLVSGFYNYLFVTRFGKEGAYHMLFGIKFLLALVVFALAIGITSRMSWAEGMRANPRLWTGVLLVFASAVVLVGGYMKVAF